MGFFGFGILAFEVSERYVQRLVTKTDSDGIHRDAFLMQCVGMSLAEAVKLGTFDSSFRSYRFQLA